MLHTRLLGRPTTLSSSSFTHSGHPAHARVSLLSEVREALATHSSSRCCDCSGSSAVSDSGWQLLKPEAGSVQASHWQTVSPKNPQVLLKAPSSRGVSPPRPHLSGCRARGLGPKASLLLTFSQPGALREGQNLRRICLRLSSFVELSSLKHGKAESLSMSYMAESISP